MPYLSGLHVFQDFLGQLFGAADRQVTLPLRGSGDGFSVPAELWFGGRAAKFQQRLGQKESKIGCQTKRKRAAVDSAGEIACAGDGLKDHAKTEERYDN